MHRYSPVEYGQNPNNLGIVQSADGRMFVANQEGILEFDGVTWRLISLPGRRTPTQLALDASGRILIGASGDIGYLATDSLYRPIFSSFLHDVVPDQDDEVVSSQLKCMSIVLNEAPEDEKHVMDVVY